MSLPRGFDMLMRPQSLFPCVCSETDRCRCGTHFGPEIPCFRFESVPNPLTDLFEGQRFCGVACARMFILEALELIESAPASSVFSELEQVRVSLRYLLAVLALESPPPASGLERPRPVASES